MRKYIKILVGNPLFAGLDEESIESILNKSSVKRFSKKAGEYILHAGDKATSMGFVLSGTAMVIQEDIWGHRNIMSSIDTGGVFAEPFAAAPNAVLNVSVVAETNCDVILLDIKRLLTVDSQDEEHRGFIVRNLVSVLAQKIMVLNDKVTHISKRSTRDKLLSFLSSEAIRRGNRVFDIAYNRQQLADYLCVDRAAMSVELSKLQNDGILRYNRNHFELKELDELYL